MTKEQLYTELKEAIVNERQNTNHNNRLPPS